MDLKNSIDLTEKISTETWLRIADCIQDFQISDGNNKEFQENLRILKECLQGTEVGLSEGNRYASHIWHVGLATLIQSIYDIQASDKKKHFAEQICALEDLGVKNICFLGSDANRYSTGSVSGIYKTDSYLHKILTDGSFSIRNEGGRSHCFEMTNLWNGTYYLGVSLALRKENNFVESTLVDATATLLSFDGVFPSKEEIMKDRLPSLDVGSGAFRWQVTNNQVQQHFEPYVKSKSL